jgi:MFS family permease
MGMALPLVPQFLEVDLGATPFVVGVVTGTYGVLQIVGRLPLGNLSDHLGRRRSLGAAFAFTFLGGFFFVFAPTPYWVIPGQALFGLASGTFWVSANSYAAEAAPEGEVDAVMARYAIAIDVGFLVGAPLGGVADVLGFRTALTAFVWAGLLGLILARYLEASQEKAELKPPRQVYAEAWGLMGVPDLTVSAVGTFAYALLFGVSSAFLPLLLRNVDWIEALAGTALFIGVLFALRSVASIVSRIPLPRFMERFGPRPVLYAGSTLGAVSLALFPSFAAATPPLAALGVTLGLSGLPYFSFAVDALPLILLALLFGVGIGLVIPANLSLVNHAAPDEARGLANGIYGTALGLGITVSPLIFGWVAEQTSIAFAFRAAAATTVLIVAGLPTLHRFLSRRREGGAEAAPAQPEA